MPTATLLSGRRRLFLAALCCALVAPSIANADVPVTERQSWDGSIDYFMTGNSMARDTNGNTKVDALALPADIVVSVDDVPPTAELVAAWLYWGGSQEQTVSTPCSSSPDRTLTISIPAVVGTRSITADSCGCSDADDENYDFWACREDLTALVDASGGSMIGTWVVDDYTGHVEDFSTNSAGAALLLVFEDPTLRPRRVTLFDGNLSLRHTTERVELRGLVVDTTPAAKLTYFTLEGDVGGSATEQVTVDGSPGGSGPLVLSDALNPPNNPMNRTINTTQPPLTDVYGVDIDEFDVTGALAPSDTGIDVTYTADSDKWWLIANVVGVDVFDPFLRELSSKSWVLQDDVDGDGWVDVGDTVRYTIHLENSGNEAATVNVNDRIPGVAASWTMVDAGNGVDASTQTELVVNGVEVAPGASVDIVFDVVAGETADETPMDNTATWSKPPQGGSPGSVTAPTISVRRDRDDDTIHDHDDNCPGVPNTDQADTDMDGIGDACVGCTDADNDGDGAISCGGGDCDDTNPNIYSGAPESCDGLDNNCDGFIPKDELTDVFGVRACLYTADPNGDADGDGLTNSAELELGTNPGAADSDDDGLDDFVETDGGKPDIDSDGDTFDDAVDADDDDDGVPTAVEVEDTQDTGDPDPDGDGDPAWLDVDSDGDTIGDATEAGDDVEDPVDTDDDGIPDYLDRDSDDDTIPDDVDNCPFIPNPGQSDADGDGVGDVCEEGAMDAGSDMGPADTTSADTGQPDTGLPDTGLPDTTVETDGGSDAIGGDDTTPGDGGSTEDCACSGVRADRPQDGRPRYWPWALLLVALSLSTRHDRPTDRGTSAD